MAINCAGRQIGDYANFPCLGLLTHNTTRDRYEPGRIPYPILKDQIKSFGMPDITLAEPVEVTINDILTQKEAFYSQRVTIKGVRFGYYKTSATNSTPSNFLTNYINMIDDTKEQIVFSEENDLNVPVSRVIKDNAGNTISVTTSFYAKFAGEYLPQGEHDIIAVIAWYRDQERNTGNFQLAIQQIGDIIKVEN